nr:carbon-nitrogen hydrolase family protein [Phyllobacterium myrsinacearum]
MTVATCQFPVSHDISANLTHMLDLVASASSAGADVVHFPECALSGYGAATWPSWDDFEWATLNSAMDRIAEAARAHAIWIVTGSVHWDPAHVRPTNSLFVFDDKGAIAGRYDKRRCSTNDLRAFAPGTTPLTVDIKGVRCGFLICLDWAFPELWQEHAGKVEMVFHSCYTDNVSRDRIEAHTIQPLIQGYAWLNQYAISSSNSCRPRQNFPSFWIERTGHRGGTATPDATGLILNALTDDPELDAFCERVLEFRRSASDGSLYAPYLEANKT